MTVYLLQVTAGIFIAWSIYRVALRGKVAAKTNRFFLLGGLTLPFLLPLIPISTKVVEAASPILLPAVSLNGQVLGVAESSSSLNWLFFIYLGGAIALFMYYISGFITYLVMVKNATVVADKKRIYRVEKATMPFSFFGSIILPRALDEMQEKIIIAHEEKHISCKHSIDIVFGALVHSLMWFFPILPFYLRDLRLEHEYEVDQLMLNETSFTHYAENLLKVSLMPIHHVNFHSFSSPKLKNRIIMMTKKQKVQRWKLLFLIPVACSLIYLNACSKQQAEVVEGMPNTMKMAEVDNVPLFPNCDADALPEEKMKCFNSGIVTQIINNMKYPEKAMLADVEGKVFVQFVIDTDGHLKGAHVLKSDIGSDDKDIIEALEQAAVNVFGEFPELTPAKKDGKAVPIEYVVPIQFALPKKA